MGVHKSLVPIESHSLGCITIVSELPEKFTSRVRQREDTEAGISVLLVNFLGGGDTVGQEEEVLQEGEERLGGGGGGEKR